MTADEKLNKLIHELDNCSIEQLIAARRSWDREACERAFVEKFNVVHQKCCKFCRFCSSSFRGSDYTCVHPERLAGLPKGSDIRWNTFATDVCNAFEELTPQNADIEY